MLVVLESTTYPGTTEEVILPALTAKGLTPGKDLFVAFSPERVDPGNVNFKTHNTFKLVGGVTEGCQEVSRLFYEQSIVKVFPLSSPRVAEMAKVFENVFRSVNIALVNELAIIFDRMRLDVHEVLRAAGTKWNFLHFTPGLVGGHCIGVDPYYLAYKAEELGHHPQIIMSGRRINDAMGRYFARELIKRMINNKLGIKDSKVLILGITFKENVPDIRNSRVIDIIQELKDFGAQIDVYDPQANSVEVREEYGIDLIVKPETGGYQAVVLAVKHREFVQMGKQKIISFVRENGIFYDVKESLKV
jgi:UDP-N-acetyl-D-galactosamine dehydrogenase